ncbi:MAG TPA: protein YgfX [Gammaproteobacteria bacterium]|nr:protein YgfX [Gammaproteobacteria bacterium]
MLNVERSRVLCLWWVMLHVLIGAAFALVGWPVVWRGIAIVAVVVHAVVRRPPPSPSTVIVAEGGTCAIPEWNTGMRPLGARTLICPFWIRLDLEAGPWRRDILLVVDQVRPEEWRQLRALLNRARCE